MRAEFNSSRSRSPLDLDGSGACQNLLQRSNVPIIKVIVILNYSLPYFALSASTFICLALICAPGLFVNFVGQPRRRVLGFVGDYHAIVSQYYVNIYILYNTEVVSDDPLLCFDSKETLASPWGGGTRVVVLSLIFVLSLLSSPRFLFRFSFSSQLSSFRLMCLKSVAQR